MVINHSFGVSGGRFNGFDTCNAECFTFNAAVNMVHPSQLSSNMRGKFDVGLKEYLKLFCSLAFKM